MSVHLPVEIDLPCSSLEQMISVHADVFYHAGVVSVSVKQHLHQAFVMKKSIMMDLDYTNLVIMVIILWYYSIYKQNTVLNNSC